MRVLHVIKVIKVAGAERHLLTLVEGQRARGVDASIVLLVEPSKPMDDYVAMASAVGIPVERVIIRSHVDFSVIGRLRGLFRAQKPDVVHTHLLHADLFGVWAARRPRVPVIISSRHNDNDFRRRQPLRTVNRLMWKLTDAGIVISEALARFSSEIEGVKPSKLHTIYYGLDYRASDSFRVESRRALRDELHLPAETPLVGMVCRLIEQKGVAYGIDAFAQVAERFPTAHLVIAGDGTMRRLLEGLVDRLNLRDRVHFLGWRPETARIFAALDVMMMPSLWEGFGLVMLEAMAQRVPIIGSRVSAIPEVIVDGETGILVPPASAPALAAALTELLADPALARHMGMMGEDRLENRFSAGRMVDETLALYHELLQRKGKKKSK